MNEFGTQVRILRKKMGVSRKELAAQVGVSDTTVSRWETGKQKPSDPEIIKNLIEVANGLH